MAGLVNSDQRVTLSTGKIITIEGFVYDAIGEIRKFPLADQLSLLSFSSDEILEIVEYQYELLDKNLRGRKWRFPEYPDRVAIDNEFVETFLPVEINKKTLFRRIRDRRLPLEKVIEINNFFKNEMVK